MWNKKNWQGRTKKRVEGNYEVLFYTTVIGFIVIVATLVISKLTQL